MGRSQADDGDGDPGQTETVAGEGSWTTDKSRTDADIELRQTATVNTETERRLKKGLVRQSANTEVDYRTNEPTHLGTERLKYWGKLGVPNNVQVLLIKTVRRT